MDIPPPGMIRNSGPCFDQTLDQPINGPPHLLSLNVKLPDHMQEVAGQNPHLQAGLVGLEPLATGFVPPKSVLSFLDPVFYLGSAIIDLDHFTGRHPGVGDHKSDPGEKRAPMPLDLGHYSLRPAPTLGLVLEVNDLDLNTACWRSPCRSVQVRSQEAH